MDTWVKGRGIQRTTWIHLGQRDKLEGEIETAKSLNLKGIKVILLF